MNGHVTQWIPAYHDGELGLARRKEVEDHLSRCTGCRLELEQLRRLSALLQEAPAPAPRTSPEHFAAQVRLRLPREKRPWENRSQGNRLWGIQAAWQACPLLLAAGWVFTQTILAFGNLALLAGVAAGLPAQALQGIRLNSPLQGLFLAPRLESLLGGSPWAGPAVQIILWIAASMSLTFFFGILVWGWVAGWWAARRSRPGPSTL
jgi:anti-sigma factor RsiW